MENINPTRMNLFLKKGEIRQVKTGIELLRNKKDVLQKEFFSSVKPLFDLRRQLDAKGKEAIHSLILSLGFEGRERLLSDTLAAQMTLEVDFTEKNLWGVRIPELSSQISILKQEFGKVNRSMHIDDTQEKFALFLTLALRLLPQEIKLKRLGNEIKATLRKVNYLDKYLLPEFLAQLKYIQEMLNEREQEDIFRLKRIKKRRID